MSPWYDPMLAKVIAHAPTRREAATALATGLEQTIIQGVVTNRDLLVQVLCHAGFVEGQPTTGFLADTYPSDADRRFPPSEADGDLATVIALVAEQHDGRSRGNAPLTVPAGFTNTGLGPMPVEVLVAGHQRTATVEVASAGIWRIDPGSGQQTTALCIVRDDDGVVVDVDGRRVRARLHVDGPSVQVVLPTANVTLLREPRFPRVAAEAEPGAALSPMPGTVVSIEVSEGDQVTVGDLLAVVEAMKMEHRITCDVDGVVASVRVEAGTQVEADDVLIVVSPTA